MSRRELWDQLLLVSCCFATLTVRASQFVLLFMGLRYLEPSPCNQALRLAALRPAPLPPLCSVTGTSGGAAALPAWPVVDSTAFGVAERSGVALGVASDASSLLELQKHLEDHLRDVEANVKPDIDNKELEKRVSRE